MALKLNAKYKNLVTLIVFICYAITIVICFISLPYYWALIITLGSTGLILLANKIVFQLHILWVHPAWDFELMNMWLGSAWIKEDIDGIPKTGLGLLYEKKAAAKDIYRMLKSWSNGKLNDINGDIVISLIKESKSKYTIVIYPGKRIESRNKLEKEAKSRFPGNCQININEAKPYIQICADYSDRAHIIELINNLQHEQYLLMTTIYVKDEKLVKYSKSFIHAYGFRLVERSQLKPGELEFSTSWSDPKKRLPVLYSRVKLLEKDLNK